MGVEKQTTISGVVQNTAINAVDKNTSITGAEKQTTIVNNGTNEGYFYTITGLLLTESEDTLITEAGDALALEDQIATTTAIEVINITAARKQTTITGVEIRSTIS